jgi:hypothetical protein
MVRNIAIGHLSLHYLYHIVYSAYFVVTSTVAVFLVTGNRLLPAVSMWRGTVCRGMLRSSRRLFNKA